MSNIVFQALFCWIDGGNDSRRAGRIRRTAVSSLVLLDRWGGTRTERNDGIGRVGFQALFCWIDGGERSYRDTT